MKTLEELKAAAEAAAEAYWDAADSTEVDEDSYVAWAYWTAKAAYNKRRLNHEDN